jgi:hypothetical protein
LTDPTSIKSLRICVTTDPSPALTPAEAEQLWRCYAWVRDRVDAQLRTLEALLGREFAGCQYPKLPKEAPMKILVDTPAEAGSGARFAHDEFQEWRTVHWDSTTQFFANAAGGAPGSYLLHKASCSHYEGCDVPRGRWNMTATEKLCGTRAEIEREVGRRNVRECSACFKPAKAASA